MFLFRIGIRLSERSKLPDIRSFADGDVETYKRLYG